MKEDLHAILDEVLDEETEFKTRQASCDYFRSGLISNHSPEEVEHFLRYMHSEPFRSNIMEGDDLCATHIEAMLVVDEAL